jgi:sugar/nucleoside kinase (ribokinase family)
MIPQVVDTTGAGDFFTAGFIHEHLRGKEHQSTVALEGFMESCCKVACNAGAAACLQYGTNIDQATFNALMNQ